MVSVFVFASIQSKNSYLNTSFTVCPLEKYQWRIQVCFIGENKTCTIWMLHLWRFWPRQADVCVRVCRYCTVHKSKVCSPLPFLIIPHFYNPLLLLLLFCQLSDELIQFGFLVFLTFLYLVPCVWVGVWKVVHACMQVNRLRPSFWANKYRLKTSVFWLQWTNKASKSLIEPQIAAVCLN